MRMLQVFAWFVAVVVDKPSENVDDSKNRTIALEVIHLGPVEPSASIQLFRQMNAVDRE